MFNRRPSARFCLRAVVLLLLISSDAMITGENRPSRRWIGLAHVQPMHGNTLLHEAKGAYVQVVGINHNIHDFAAAAAAYLFEYGFEVIGFDDVEDFDKKSKNSSISPCLAQLANSLHANDKPIGLSTFHTYIDD